MRPITGGRLKIVLVGVAGSLFVAILVIGLFAALDDRLYASSDVEGILNDGIIVVIPSAPRRIAAKGG
jgi:capsular polysaccharide biosynthesis protein